jgi:hypothetical protein
MATYLKQITNPATRLERGAHAYRLCVSSYCCRVQYAFYEGQLHAFVRRQRDVRNAAGSEDTLANSQPTLGCHGYPLNSEPFILHSFQFIRACHKVLSEIR